MTFPASTMRPSLDRALARNAIAAESTPIFDATVRDHAKADVTARFAAEFADVLTACTTCGARVGETCRTATGKATRDHAGRRSA